MLILKRVRDEDLLRQLLELVKRSRGVEAEVVAHIGEVERRRLYAREACSSMFEYCRRVLGLRENEAYLRITVARVSRENPVLLDMLRDGRMHLSGIARLAPHLTRENSEAVLKRACGMSHREIRELVSELEPRPDVAPSIRKLPHRPDRLPERTHALAEPPHALAEPPHALAEPPHALAEPPHALAERSRTLLLRPAGNGLQLGAPRVESDNVNPGSRVAAPSRPPVVEPLAPNRYQVRFTAGTELRDKLERLQALLRSSVPDGDLARIIDIAVTEKLQRVEGKRFGQTKSPRRGLAEADTTPSSRHIPAAVRRAVYVRDGGRCAYRDKYGRRCARRHDLEFHHRHPFARGGDHRPVNVALMCRAHNTLLAVQDYGEDVMARFRAATSRASVPVDAGGPRIVVQPRWPSSG